MRIWGGVWGGGGAENGSWALSADFYVHVDNVLGGCKELAERDVLW